VIARRAVKEELGADSQNPENTSGADQVGRSGVAAASNPASNQTGGSR